MYDVRFYGHSERSDDGNGRALWTGGQEVLAIAYDVMIPGYGTQTTNNLRLWESKPKRGFDLNSFNGISVLLCTHTCMLSRLKPVIMRVLLNHRIALQRSRRFCIQMIIREPPHCSHCYSADHLPTERVRASLVMSISAHTMV